MQQQQRILIAPLDWGLGHATRCIPIIRYLLEKQQQVIVAADGRPLALLRKEFPDIEHIQLKGYSINYARGSLMILKMLFSIPKILKGIYREHQALNHIIKTRKIDVVISDNRFGLWNKNVRCIFITHQTMIKSPFGVNLLHLINLNFIHKYTECWIPDEEGEINLSGDLSHKFPLPRNAFFVGLLSRFNSNPNDNNPNDNYSILIILSGPEPQRTIFENILLKQLDENGLKTLIVRGMTDQIENTEINKNITMITHLCAEEMQKIIEKSELIIARSGYSTIMDMATLGKKVVFVPTPGQTEQEYLARLLEQKKIAYFQSQSKFNLKEALIESKKYSGFIEKMNNNKIEQRLEILLNTMKE